MPTRICEKCEKIVDWRNTRGSSAPHVCECGGRLRRAAWDEKAGCWGRAEEKPRQTGRRMKCPICGRHRLDTGSNVRATLRACVLVKTSKYSDLTVDRLELPAGTKVCWWHTKPDGDLVGPGHFGYGEGWRIEYPEEVAP